MKFASRVLFVVACVIGAASVLLAAYVAHQGDALSPASLKSLQSALLLQHIHALALAGVCAVGMLHMACKTLLLSALLFTAGLLMFSLNICLIHLADITLFKAFTPYGGMAFVAGWLCLGWWGWRLR